MEIREIKTFVKIAELRSFSKAAEELNYSQAAVTLQIKSLEKELGFLLFDRVTKPISVTAEGERFYQEAETILRLLQSCGKWTEDEDLSGNLRIGTMESITSPFLKDLLAAFHGQCPKVTLSIVTGTSQSLIQLLEENRIDTLLILDEKIRNKNYASVFEESENLCFVCTPEYRKKISDFPDTRELLSHPLLLSEKGSVCRNLLEDHALALQIPLQPILESDNTDILIQMLNELPGIAFLPEDTVRKELARNTLCSVSPCDSSFQLYKQVLYHKNKWVSPQMKVFFSLF